MCAACHSKANIVLFKKLAKVCCGHLDKDLLHAASIHRSEPLQQRQILLRLHSFRMRSKSAIDRVGGKCNNIVNCRFFSDITQVISEKKSIHTSRARLAKQRVKTRGQRKGSQYEREGETTTMPHITARADSTQVRSLSLSLSRASLSVATSSCASSSAVISCGCASMCGDVCVCV